jgi:hypothetical protein
MGKFTLQNVRLFTGGADLTTRNNKIALSSEAAEQDATAFVPTGDAWKEVLGGLKSTKLSASGQWEAGDPGKVDDVSFADLGGLSAVTVCPATAAVGSLAWLTSAMRGSYKVGDAVGSVAPWDAELAGSWPLARGVVLHDPGTARSANGTGTAVLHLPAAAGQHVYGALHVLSLTGTAGPSITVKVQADNAAGFASPVDVLSFSPATSRGGQVLRTPGPLADNYYRASWTVSGTGPSALFLLSVGVI